MKHTQGRRFHRGMALVATLFAVVLIMTLLTVMVEVGTMRLRRSTEELRAAQALAAADAGAAWVRALLFANGGDVSSTLTGLSQAHSTLSLTIDPLTSATVLVSVAIPGASAQADHLDVNLQENPQIVETPIQVVATATVETGGAAVATRTVTTLLRSFHHLAPYSEIVGLIDDAGPESIDSPGDPAGQVGAPDATDLRLFAYRESGSSAVPANKFQSDSWFDGNTGASGFLP